MKRLYSWLFSVDWKERNKKNITDNAVSMCVCVWIKLICMSNFRTYFFPSWNDEHQGYRNQRWKIVMNVLCLQFVSNKRREKCEKFLQNEKKEMSKRAHKRFCFTAARFKSVKTKIENSFKNKIKWIENENFFQVRADNLYMKTIFAQFNNA